MKNKEKFAKEIIEIACSGDSIAVIKKSGHIVSCNGVECDLCLFCDEDCRKKTRAWAESEYIEKPVISKKDRAFLEYLDKQYEYLARDASGELYIYTTKPCKQIDCWNSSVACEVKGQEPLRMFNVDFPIVKWSDKEPWLIEDLKKLEVVEEYD